ncbi:SspB family protein [Gimibacter soli]|uniref:ClpXP protease specificity-enhancing factor SspB n=1 Tax=Gimibacter soli TaxID=3024400 RepID=A0AAE9XMB7_9PROT|nr:ClpXP protease specificity-enhancing factor SspB [Gimibacter soli]WCL53577.1 ClpXP protease specificity-enhancing factor SspB [Gimibacter soli]
MSENHIDYDAKVQEALRGVVRSVLEDTAVEGLQGDHHFYIAFKSQAPGVDIPAHLKSRFPDEMTIVLQHKFWGLKVYEDRFEVGLSFNQRPEHLVIPFSAIVGFVDPSVQFALQFHDHGDDGADLDILEEYDEDELEADSDDDTKEAEAEAYAPAAPAGEPGDNVVTLDAFRKK